MNELEARIEQNRKDQQRLKEEEQRLLRKKDTSNQLLMCHSLLKDRGKGAYLGLGVLKDRCSTSSISSQYATTLLNIAEVKKAVDFMTKWLERENG